MSPIATVAADTVATRNVGGGTVKITRRQLRRIIKESMMNWTPKEQASYDEGFEQGNHDAIEQMGQGEVMRHMFASQEEYEAFVAGYDDGYHGTMDVLPSR